MASVGDRWAKMTPKERTAARAQGQMRWEARWRGADGKSHKRRTLSQAEAWALASSMEGTGTTATSRLSPTALAALLASDARAAERSIRAMRESGEMTVAHAVAALMHDKRHLSPRGLENAKLHAGHVLETFGARVAESLQRSEIEDWVAGSTAAASSTGKRLTLLRAALRRVGVPDPTAGARFRAAQAPTPRGQTFEPLEPHQLFAMASAARLYAPGGKHGAKPGTARPNADIWYALILLLGTLGLRVSEALDLRVQHLDPLSLRLTIPGTKTASSSRIVTVPLPLFEVLEPLTHGKEPDSYLFATSSGTRINRERVGDRVREASMRALGRQLRPHDLRHSAAAALVAKGDLLIASRVLGHANPGITAAIYGHARRQDIEATVKAVGDELDEVFWPFGRPPQGNDESNEETEIWAAMPDCGSDCDEPGHTESGR